MKKHNYFGIDYSGNRCVVKCSRTSKYFVCKLYFPTSNTEKEEDILFRYRIDKYIKSLTDYQFLLLLFGAGRSIEFLVRI